jgi:hypothetical protein
MLLLQSATIRAANKRLQKEEAISARTPIVKNMPSLGSCILVSNKFLVSENSTWAKLITGKLHKQRFKVCFVDAFVYATLHGALRRLSVLNSTRKNHGFGSFMLIHGRNNHGS